jgi:pilus assembly protein Flp/PilA|tara:strand:- start:3813 stop:4067 length:255 start_codon:yes stop_codon:yes gene_type:complete
MRVYAFLNAEDGTTAIEYGIIAALIAVVIIGSVSLLGTQVSSTFDMIAGALPFADGAGGGVGASGGGGDFTSGGGGSGGAGGFF